jgi:ParB family chromosome partitioning protein
MKHEPQTKKSLEIVQINPHEIRYFVRRSRTPGAYTRLKESIKQVGLRQPIHVRDISQWTATERRRAEGGGLYKYELICGQGRLQAFRELGLPKIPALIIDVPEDEIVGRFLAENVMRKRLSWYEKAQLIKQDVERGMDVDEIKDKYFLTTKHVYKYLRILGQASTKLLSDAEIEKLSMNEAEELTSLTSKEQEIIVEVLKEEQLGNEQIKPLVRKTKELRKTGEVSKVSLKGSLRDLDKGIKEVHTRLKSKRLHWSLGPFHLKRLLDTPEYRVVLDKEEINYTDFLQVTMKGEKR